MNQALKEHVHLIGVGVLSVVLRCCASTDGRHAYTCMLASSHPTSVCGHTAGVGVEGPYSAHTSQQCGASPSCLPYSGVVPGMLSLSHACHDEKHCTIYWHRPGAVECCSMPPCVTGCVLVDVFNLAYSRPAPRCTVSQECQMLGLVSIDGFAWCRTVGAFVHACSSVQR